MLLKTDSIYSILFFLQPLLRFLVVIVAKLVITLLNFCCFPEACPTLIHWRLLTIYLALAALDFAQDSATGL
jgi:hypothetical protein